jgi:glycosyltransferase involved in cell wall biosynthesis
MNPSRPLIVTGMHRSGTSFVASLLAAWNVRMGRRLVPADRGNPAGYFEDVDFLALNRRMLIACTPEENGHRDWGWTESERFDPEPLASFRDEASALAASRAGEGTWGWKDPRTSMLLDFWSDLLGSEARFLLLYRHPWEVADSMLRTGADLWLSHPGYPARIWTQYNRRILDFHRRHRERTLLVSTNRLLRTPEAFAEILRQRFDVDADAQTIAALRDAESFVSPPDDDPLLRLWQFANREAMELLGALDDAADLGNARRWEPASRSGAPQRAEQPRVSIVIPCHDDGEYLIEAVASVERHAPAAELLIVDDGSTQPRTREVLAALTNAGHRVLAQPHSGLSAARNFGIAAAAGAYVLPLDADNRLLPGFVEEAVALLDADSGAGVVYGDRREFGARSGDVVVPEFDLSRMLWSNYIDACAVMRRSVWSECGGYDVEFAGWEDWEFWLRVAWRGWRFAKIPRVVFEYRVRPDSLQHRLLRANGYAAALRRLYGKHADLVSEHATRVLFAAHDEQQQLFENLEALRASRDEEIASIRSVLAARDEELASIRAVLAARDEELASIHAVLAARDEELASVKFVLQARDEELTALRSLQSVEPHAGISEPALTGATRVFTIIARNYLAHARVLAASLARHNPHARLQVVILDDSDRTIASELSFDVLHADELPFESTSDFFTMAAMYDVTELATAVKPWAFEHLFARGASVAIYLDPDIEVFDSLGPLEPLAREHGIVLTPHVTEPLPRDGKRPDERDLLIAGIYNLGFLALSAESAKTFLPWWRERLRFDCLNQPAEGLFVDQRWIDFAPAFFEPHILKDAGYNVAYWNLPHRVLARSGDRIVVNGQPLRFFHFSGFSPRTPHLLSKHQHASVRVSLSREALLAELCQRYGAALNAAGFAEQSAIRYAFETSIAGVPLDARTRRVLRRTYIADAAAGRAVPNPFSPAAAGDVIERLMRPSPHAPGVPGWLGEIWSDRADLRLAFPRIDSLDAERFLEWVRMQGIREHNIPQHLIPPEGPATAAPVPRRETLQPGVNVYGYAFAESGTGQIVRSVVAALSAEGIPYAVVPFTRTLSRQQQEFREFGAASPSFDTNLICVNADQVPLFFESMRGQLLPDARNVGLWAWEVEDLPAAMARSEEYLHEVWGISSFTADALARSASKPVAAFPLPVAIPQVQRRSRAELGMPEGFLFLFCFDYDSVFRRKNPLAVVAAFRQAFGDRSDVALFIKTTNAARHAAEDEELRAAAAGRANIVIRDAYVTSGEYFSMLDACDCYVSLHRAEGFGLTVAEAMALGKPVISTAYSSTLEFTNESNSYLVPAQLVAVGPDAPPYPRDSRWAEPDVAAAAQQMSRVFAARDAAAAIGARARADIETLHSPSARGALLRRLLEESRMRTKTVQTNIMTPPITEPAGAFEADALAAESLLRSPRPDLPSRLHRIATPLRSLVLRFIRVYWVQQLGIDRALLAAMRTLRRESASEIAAQAALLRHHGATQDRLAAETARLREDLARVTDDVRTLQKQLGASNTETHGEAEQGERNRS